MRVKQRITAIVLAAIAALAASASFVLSGDDQAPRFDEPVVMEVEASRAPAAPSVVEMAGEGDAATGWDEDDGGVTAPREELAPPSAQDVLDAPPIRVRVVDAATKAPVARAEIFWAALADPNERQRFGDLPGWGRFGGGSRHVAVGLIARGTKRVTDDLGETMLPGAPWRIAVAARAKDRVGFAELDRGRGEELVVALVSDEPIAVLVVDPTGEPRAKAPVIVMQSGGNRERGGNGVLWSGETDDEGLARVPYFRLHVREGLGTEFLAFLAVPLDRPEFAAFVAEPLPKDPIRLTMPATGWVELSVVDPDQRPLDSALRVWVRPKRGDGKQQVAILPKGFEAGGWFDAAMATKPRGATSVRLGPIGLGLELRAGMRFTDRGRGGERIEGPWFAGPRAHDQVVTTTLVTPDWLAIVRGRVIDPSGAPHAAGRLPCQVRDTRRPWFDGGLELDADGRFELGVRVDQAVTPEASLEIVERHADGTCAAGLAPLPGFAANARLAIGEVRLAEVQPLARGRVIDERGEPVRRARVQVQVSFDGQRFLDGGLARNGVAEDGSFLLFGVPPSGALRIAASAEDHLPEFLPLVAAGTRLEVTLQRAVDMRFVVQVPAGMPQQALSAELRAQDGQKRGFELRVRGDNAGFVAEDLPRGSYDLAILLRNFAGDLRTVRAINVHPDLDRAQRTVTVDLRDALHAYAIEVVGAGSVVDEAVRGVLVTRAAGADGNLGWQAFPVNKGRAAFVAPQGMLEAWFIPEGRGEVRATLRPGTTRMVTSTIHPVELELPGLRSLVGERTVRVSLVLLADTGLPPGIAGIDQNSGGNFRLERAAMAKSGGAWLGGDDRVRIPVTRNGRYQVVVRLHARNGRGGQESRAIGEIDVVVDGIRPTSLSIPIDTIELQKALDRMRGR